jgi:hypothetical protein
MNAIVQTIVTLCHQCISDMNSIPSTSMQTTEPLAVPLLFSYSPSDKKNYDDAGNSEKSLICSSLNRPESQVIDLLSLCNAETMLKRAKDSLEEYKKLKGMCGRYISS